MDKSAIISQINSTEQHFINEKDGGRAFIAALAKEINQYSLQDRKNVIDFLIHELQTDENGMRRLVLPLLEDMDATEAAPEIFGTYLNFLIKDEDIWEKRIVTTLFLLRYTEPQAFYLKYAEKYIAEKPDNGYNFFMGVLYCRVEPNKGINILSDYFCRHLKVPDNDMVAFFRNRLGFLVINFSKNPHDHTIRLIRETVSKNREAGIRLKEIFLYYFHSDLVKNYSEEYVREKIRILDELDF
jgi:hypothetical protein